MRLLCHDAGCEGHSHPAGNDPGGCCRYCEAPLADGLGILIIEDDRAYSTPTDLIAVGICSVHGHSWEGCIPRGLEELRGACARCNLQITLAV